MFVPVFVKVSDMSCRRSDVSDRDVHSCKTVRGKKEAMQYDVLGANPVISAVPFKNEWVVCLFPLYSKIPRIRQRYVHGSDFKKSLFWWDAQL